MEFSDDLVRQQFIVLTLIFARVLTLVTMAPIFGSAAVPARMRILLALALAGVVAPIELQKASVYVDSLVDYLVLLGGEALIGLALGLGVLVFFSSVQVAGQLISQLCGLQLADAYDPTAGGQTNVISQLLLYVTLAVFVAIGGHRLVVEGLLDTFAWTPAGQGTVARAPLDAMTSLLAHSFALGIRAAAPALVALLMASVILGLVSRMLPQLNLLALGFSFNVLVMLAVVSLSLGAAVWAFQSQMDPMLQTALESLRPESPR